MLSLFVFVLHAAVTVPQTSPVARPLSLDEALGLAEERSEVMTIARAGVTRAQGEEKRARSELLPQLNGSASYDRALASEFSGLFDDPGDGGGDDGGFGNFDDLPFGRRNTYRFNLNFSQNLFSGGRIGAQRNVAAASRATAETTLASARAELRLDVVRAYYDAALSARLAEIADATYKQADATLAQVRLGYQAGSQPEFELLRAQVTRDNQRPNVIRSQSQRDIAMLRLKQLLDLPADQPLVLTTPLDGDTLPPPAPFAAEFVQAAAETDLNRATVRQAEIAIRIREAAVDIARAQRRPSVNVTSAYGEVNYPSNPFPDFTDFRRNWTVGVIAQMPIFNGGRIDADIAIARADAEEARARLQQTRELALVDTQTAHEELRAAQASWEASAGTVQQAQRAYEIAELRYREGVSTQLELNDARLLLVQAQAGRAQAARDLQVARVRVALLPDLPIGAGATPSTTGIR